MEMEMEKEKLEKLVEHQKAKLEWFAQALEQAQELMDVQDKIIELQGERYSKMADFLIMLEFEDLLEDEKIAKAWRKVNGGVLQKPENVHL